MTVLDDLLSQDSERIDRARWTLLRTRDAAVIGPVADRLDEVEAALGERPDPRLDDHGRDHVLDRIRRWRAGRCLCGAYPHSDRYDVERELAAGHITVSSSTPGKDWQGPWWVVACTDCGRRFEVEQGQYHWTWWRWMPAPDRRVLSRRRCRPSG